MPENSTAAAAARRVSKLLDRAQSDRGLTAELARARREFFGADRPNYVDPKSRLAMDAAALRFAEWFVIDRQSEVLGNSLLETFGDPSEDRMLFESRVGVFLVENAGSECVVRDLEGNEALQLVVGSSRLGAGDVLVGRLFPRSDGSFEPSDAVALLPRSPQLALAFQRDAKRLELGRRLDQAEIEHVVFRQWAAFSASSELSEGDAEELPLERLEAELQTALDAAEVDDDYSATSISAALVSAGENAGSVVSEVLDSLAYDTDVDLDRARELIVRMRNVIAAGGGNKPMPAPAPRAADTAPRRFEERVGEHLGQRLARRIEEGLGSAEGLDAIFADVERMLGESIEDGDEEPESDATLDDGDLEPLIAEYAWEQDLDAVRSDRLLQLVAAQRDAPVPRLCIEYLDSGDWQRWFLAGWLDAAPSERAASIQRDFDLASRFLDWLVAEHTIDVRDRLPATRDTLLAAADRLQAATLLLTDAAVVRAAVSSALAGATRLWRVLDCSLGRLRLECTSDGEPRAVAVPEVLAQVVQPGDLLFAALVQGHDGDRVVGPVAFVDAAQEGLLLEP
ncbi:MAG: hypothetical protein AB7I19_01665 [Planctomycetota bacterium]